VTAKEREEAAAVLRTKRPMVINLPGGEMDVSFESEHQEEIAVIAEIYREAARIKNAKIFIPK